MLASPRLFSLLTILIVAPIATAQKPQTLREQAIALVELPRPTIWMGMKICGGKLLMDGDTPLLRRQIAEAKRACELEPESTDRVRELADLLERAKLFAESAECLKKIVPILRAKLLRHPDDLTARTELVYALPQDDPELEKHALLAIQFAPDRYEAWHAFAFTQTLKNRPAIARQAMAFGLTKAPATLEALIAYQSFRMTRAVLLANSIQKTEPDATETGIRVPGDVSREIDNLSSEIRAAAKSADDLVRTAIARLKADHGQCGLNTRKQCLELLTHRDVIRMMPFSAGLPPTEKPPEATWFADDTVQLVATLYPATIDDPHQLFGTAFFLFMNWAQKTGGTKEIVQDERMLKTLTPYLDRLRQLANDRDDVTAVTAAACLSMVLMPFQNDRTAAKVEAEIRQLMRNAVTRIPTFELGWKIYVTAGFAKDSDDYRNLTQEYLKATGSPLSHLGSAMSQAARNNWPEASRIIGEGLVKTPNDPWLLLSRAACLLRTATPEALELADKDLVTVGSQINTKQFEGTRELMMFTRLVVLRCALYEDLPSLNSALDLYRERCDDAKDLQAILQLAPSPVIPVGGAKLLPPAKSR